MTRTSPAGYSKGSCWFCHQYVGLLETRSGNTFAEPVQHNTVIPGVRFPQATSDEGRQRVQRMKDSMNGVVLETLRGILLKSVPEDSKYAHSTSAWPDEEMS
jgi:hypothetical protein